MNKSMKMIWFSVVLAGLLSGCALLNKFAPSQYDPQGNPIPGTHELTTPAKTVIDATGPYGQAAVAAFLMVWGFIERAKANKKGNGLVATLTGLKQAGQDPKTKAAFEEVKAYIKNAHDSAGVRKDIDEMLATI